jgi:hypothetical protein
LKAAQTVIVVPGYGMAVSQAQHAVRDLAAALQKRGCEVKYAIHPVAGRMPGHMNVLLAEANVPYDDLYDLDMINDDFSRTDAVLIIGANDVVNPAAKNDPKSPIYGMPVFNVEQSRSILVLKRSMAAGFSGVENELFFLPNTMMVLGDAKKTLIGMFAQVLDVAADGRGLLFGVVGDLGDAVGAEDDHRQDLGVVARHVVDLARLLEGDVAADAVGEGVRRLRVGEGRLTETGASRGRGSVAVHRPPSVRAS